MVHRLTVVLAILLAVCACCALAKPEEALDTGTRSAFS